MWTCPVCGNTNESTICRNCDFDSSCHYENYPTLQSIGQEIPAVSRQIAKREAENGPNLEKAMAYLRAQGWEEQVLTAIEKILERAVEQRKPKQEVALYCDHCGYGNGHGILYCIRCGTKLRQQQMKTEPIPAPQKKKQVDSNRCPHCGVAILRKSAYCTECGGKL